MAKPRGPALSLAAQGSLASSLTFSNYKGITVAKRIPTHRDARTLAQLYQRWRYYDARQRWHTLTPDQQAAYRTQGSRHHLIGWQEFCHQYLPDPEDQALWLTLDTAAAGQTPDRSGKGNHATIHGPTLATGIIDHAFHFDGLDDYLDCGADASLDITQAITVMAWIYQTASFAGQFITPYIVKGVYYANWSYYLGQSYTYLLIEFNLVDPGGNQHTITTPERLDQWVHVAGTYDGATQLLYINGIAVASLSWTGTIKSTILPVKLGFAGYGKYPGLIDEARIYNRALTQGHIQHIAASERAAPPF